MVPHNFFYYLTHEGQDRPHARRRKHQEEEAQEVRRRAPCGFSGWPTTSEIDEYAIDGQQKAEEIQVPELDEQDLTNRYLEDLFKEVPCVDPMNEQQDDDDDNDNYAETPRQQPTTTTYISSCSS